jgi:hypothetical protein
MAHNENLLAQLRSEMQASNDLFRSSLHSVALSVGELVDQRKRQRVLETNPAAQQPVPFTPSIQPYFWTSQLAHTFNPLLRLAVYQGSSVLGDVHTNLTQIEKQARAAKEQNASLIVFPETFLSGYDIPRDKMMECAFPLQTMATSASPNSPFIVQHTMYHIRTLARSIGIAICVGYAERVEDPSTGDGFRIYNSAVLVDYAGDIVINYRKTHLWGEVGK